MEDENVNKNEEKKHEKEVEFDELLTNYLGEFGRYQKVSFFVLFYAWMISGFFALNPVFTAGVPDHWCDIKEDAVAQECSWEDVKKHLLPQEERHGIFQHTQCTKYELPLNTEFQCNATENYTSLSTTDCTKWHYDDKVFGSSVVTEWDLVCSKQWWVSNVNGVHWIGKIVGLIIWGHLGDRFGRKIPTIVGSLLTYVAMAGEVWAPNYFAFLVAKFFTSVVFCGRDITITVLCVESFGISYRVTAIVLANLGWSLSYLFLTGIAYFERRWRYILIWGALPDLLVPLLVMFILPESPRWLLAKGRDTEAWKVIQKISRWNRRKIPDDIVPYVKPEVSGASVLQLVKKPYIRICSIMQALAWFLTCFVYYGITLNLGSFGKDIYISFMVGGLVEIPTTVMMVWVYKKFGRIPCLGCTVMAGAVFLFISFFLPQSNEWMLTSCALIGKLFVNLTFNSLWIYTLEVYPTSIRNIGISTMSSVSRFGSIIASYVGNLSSVHRALPLMIFGLSAFIAGGSVFILPETKDQSLKQTVEEGEAFMKENLFQTCKCCRKKTDVYVVAPQDEATV